MNQETITKDARKSREWLAPFPEPVVNPFLVAVSGLPGTGKSYFSRQLSEKLDCVIIESDALRKKIFSPPTYSSQESQHLFQVCHFLAEDLLKKGISVIVDATNLIEYHRERLYRIAEQLGLKLIIVRVEAPQEIVLDRLRKRAQGRNPSDNSDADLRVYQRMKSQVQQVQRNHFVVDTSRDITPVINKIVREVRRNK
jgi:hypothetical protein